MEIEKEIQQKKPFRNNRHRAMVNLMYTSNWLRDSIKKLLKPHGLTLQQYNVLRILKGAEEPITTSIIRERLLDKMADTSRLVERLSQKGLVNRKVCSFDKRLVDVSLSKTGLELVESLNQQQSVLDNIFKNLTEEEALLMSQLLDKVRMKK